MRSSVDGLTSMSLDEPSQESFEKDLTEEEILEGLTQRRRDKSPGLGGFNMGFL